MNKPLAEKDMSVEQLAGMSFREKQQGNLDRALQLTSLCLKKDPGNAEQLNELGVIYYQMSRIKKAVNVFLAALKVRPAYPLALNNLGACYNDLGYNRKALECYRKSLLLEPGRADTWANQGNACNDLEEYEMATYSFLQAFRLRPDGKYYRGLAKAYRKSGRFDRALDVLKKGAKATPDDPDLHYSLALSHFHMRQYAQGLKEFEWRLQVRDMMKHKQDLHPIFEAPLWQGEDLGKATLLLHTEQGFGDNLQFSRFIRLLENRVGKLVMWSRPGLKRLFTNSFPAIEEYSENVFKLPAFDYQLPVLSLPLHFDPELSTLEDETPYLLHEKKSPKLKGSRKNHLKVGLVWGASDSGFDHANKKVPLKQLAPLFELKNIVWYSLQVGSDRDDLTTNENTQAFPGHDLGADFSDFQDTANAINQLDLVISVDTSVAHLTGGMGKPLWVMLKKNPDWRWHADGEKSEWYPSARLYRQDSPGDWSMVIMRILKDLENRKL